jgi:Putative beta-barrel porin-2, OmpL-like. bbp2
MGSENGAEGTPPALAPTAESTQAATTPAASESGGLAGTTVNFLIDGYYEYNFNAPIGRANLLRAYDVSSNSFSLNQADVILENLRDPANGKRWGARLDLQFGQATQTLQGNQSNEPRPEIYREIFQTYGTYVIPAGNGITVDFGKWSSSLGIKGNYTKDQINYSRSFWFDYLPFYHMGVRVKYKVNDLLSLNYWVTNGTQQTEAYKVTKTSWLESY